MTHSAARSMVDPSDAFATPTPGEAFAVPPTWRAGPTGTRLWASPEWEALTGQDQYAGAGWGWLEAIAAGDRATVREAWSATGTRSLQVIGRVIGRDGSARRFLHQASWSNAGGTGGEWIGVSLDLETAVEARDRRRALVGELQHRSRNTLATIRSLVRQGSESATDVEDFVAHLDGRLGAVSRAQAVITRNPLAAVDLRGLIVDEMAALATREGDRLTIAGPTLAIPIALVQPIALTIHELATNAVKFGALEGRAGEVLVSWQVTGNGDARVLELGWHERLPPGAPAPVQSHRGFGTALLENGLPYEIDARIRSCFAPDGVQYRFVIPLPGVPDVA